MLLDVVEAASRNAGERTSFEHEDTSRWPKSELPVQRWFRVDDDGGSGVLRSLAELATRTAADVNLWIPVHGIAT